MSGPVIRLSTSSRIDAVQEWNPRTAKESLGSIAGSVSQGITQLALAKSDLMYQSMEKFHRVGRDILQVFQRFVGNGDIEAINFVD